jgi:hypothetical protein
LFGIAIDDFKGNSFGITGSVRGGERKKINNDPSYDRNG